MKSSRFSFSVCVGLLVLAVSAAGQAKKTVTFDRDVAPIVKQHCLPCHLEENENPSELAMDNYALLMKGGKKGNTIVGGKPKQSTFYLKLLADPPFGKQMPRRRQKLTEEEIKVIYDWIEGGASER